MTILLGWLGNTDLRASEAQHGAEQGPLLNALKALAFSDVHLLSDHPIAQARDYARWLERNSGSKVTLHSVKLTSPTNYEEIYRAAVKLIRQVRSLTPAAELTFHLSPGTPAMASIWLLLAKTLFPARLIESSRGHGVKQVNVPFELSIEFNPKSSRDADDDLTRRMQGLPPESPAFTAIIHRCAVMKRTIAMAHRLALRDVPVLIQGESGTGKELIARAIRQASARGGKPFLAINCGAIPQELVDAELFGHERGAFSGATAARAGYFESADGGTLFLDEIGELPLASQVRLLRVLQEREVTRVGATKPRSIDVRIIAATNRLLTTEIQAGRFREDLYHRLAVGVLFLPPLRAREGDLGILIDAMLKAINSEAALQPGYEHKELAVAARKLLLRHDWPGNVRELHNCLFRASIWANGDKISGDDIAESLAMSMPSKAVTVLGQPLGLGFSLSEVLAGVARHYLERGILQAHGNKSEAARLLGLGSYQTLTNWLEKYEIE
jgi:transcriptional regulator with PAS, ATPase and Fis domain